MRIYLLIIGILIISNTTIYAQNEPLFSTPSASALGYGVFSEFNDPTAVGIAPVNVPVYTIKYRGLTIPITLDYNVNLVKPDFHPGWTGLGWNLNTGGVISRVVNDKPDDLNWVDFQTHQYTNEEHVGFFYNYNYLAGTGWSSTANIQNATKDWVNYPDYFTGIALAKPVKDYKPDEFNFNFLNYSGVFYLDETRHWRVRCNQGMAFKVLDTENTDFLNPEFANTQSFGKFTIVDDKGIQYVFGGTVTAIEYTSNLIKYDQALFYPKSWYLTAIILPDGDSIQFNYERGETSFTAIPSYYTSNSLNSIQHQGSVIATSYLKSISTKQEMVNFFRSNSTELGYTSTMFANDYNNWQKAFLAWLHIFDSGLPVLHYDNWFDSDFMAMPLKPAGNWGQRVNNTRWAQLDYITVSDNKNILYKYTFDYTKSTAERLKLQSVTQTTADNLSVTNRYTFIYNTGVMLPPYLSNKTDHWGYYNGKTLDLSNYTKYNLSKKPDAAFGVAEVLTQIVYPTGGKRVYSYQGNDFTFNVDSVNRTNALDGPYDNLPTGGLRVSRIVNYDTNNTQVNAVDFFYDKDHFVPNSTHRSSGILGGKVNYTYFTSGNDVINIGLSSTYPLSHNNNGSHISYSEVTTQFADKSYKVFNYSNFDTNMDENPVIQLGTNNTLYENFSSHGNERGRILRERIYTADSYLLIDKSTGYSNFFNNATDFVRSISTEADETCAQSTGGCNINTYKGAAYKTYTNAYLPTSQTTITAEKSSTPVTQSTTFNYDPVALNKISEVTTDSKGRTIEDDILYPSDMVNSGQDPTGVYNLMVKANILSSPIRQVKKLNGVQQTLTACDYIHSSTNIFVPQNQSIQLKSNPAQQILQFTGYDDFGNLLSRKKTNGVSRSYQWGYNNNYPTVVIDNASTVTTSVISAGGGNITMPQGSRATYVRQLSISAAGTISMYVDLGGDFGSGPAWGTVQCEIKGPNYYNSFGLCIGYNGASCGNLQPNITIPGLQPGNYTLTATIYDSNVTVPIDLTFVYPIMTTSLLIKDFYYDGFEEGSGTSTKDDCRTGHLSFIGAYNKVLSGLSSRSYVLSYWLKSGTSWALQTQPPVNVTGGTYAISIPNGQIDDVRFCPVDAQMTTYTYDPLIGMTSATDSNNQTTYYDYDGFQRLINVRDKDRNIIKHTDYHYQNQ